MLLKGLLCNILFIPLIYSSNTIPSKPDSVNNNTQPDVLRAVNVHDVTKIPPMLTEGGSLLPGSLHNSDNDIIKNKKNTVKARKGAVYQSDEDSRNMESVEKTSRAMNNSSTKDIKAPGKVDVPNVNLNNTTNKPITTKLSNKTASNNSSTTGNMTTKTAIHKPTILSSDELAKAEVKFSPAADQLPTLNRGTKVYASANSHPGMVMPVVITILLVPMFAVLGYMALRRGKEAWNNRHYKRMDFLLDGMYND